MKQLKPIKNHPDVPKASTKHIKYDEEKPENWNSQAYGIGLKFRRQEVKGEVFDANDNLQKKNSIVNKPEKKELQEKRKSISNRDKKRLVKVKAMEMLTVDLEDRVHIKTVNSESIRKKKTMLENIFQGSTYGFNGKWMHIWQSIENGFIVNQPNANDSKGNRFAFKIIWSLENGKVLTYENLSTKL